MSSSLRDQLIAAGLVTKKQAQQANQPKRPPSRHQPAPPSQDKSAALRAQQSKEERDRELNRRREEKAAAKARRQEIRQLVEQNRLPKIESDDYFNFVDGKTLQRICVDAAQRQQIMQGTAVIVRYGNHYALVPETAAPKILERDPHAVVALNAQSSAAAADENDPYKDFQVPDDLMW
ncbi:MAG TPA: DUF2058 domain-containing protein [Steroidobacteraceae bacterium]|jgi:hypothetical protein